MAEEEGLPDCARYARVIRRALLSRHGVRYSFPSNGRFGVRLLWLAVRDMAAESASTMACSQVALATLA